MDGDIVINKGLVHIYTGDGKGKTTAAFGLAMRCRGCGNKVYIVQFLKTTPSGEVRFIDELDNEDLKVFRFESAHGFYPQMSEEAKATLNAEMEKAMDFVETCIRSSSCDMLILDEILGALQIGLISMEWVLGLISGKPASMELVLTGRNAPQRLIDAADYVTEMTLVKHPYEQGIQARNGIEF